VSVGGAEKTNEVKIKEEIASKAIETAVTVIFRKTCIIKARVRKGAYSDNVSNIPFLKYRLDD
jgi:hypothetical protein